MINNDQLKILVLTHMYPNSMNPNLGIFIHKQVSYLVKKGCRVKVISPVPYAPKLLWFQSKWKGYGQIPLFEIIDDIPVYFPRYVVLPGAFFRNLSCYSMYLGIKKTVYSLIKEFNPNVVHAHMATSDGYVGLMLKKKYNLPLICSFRGDDINIYPFCGKLIMHFTKKLISNADSLVSVSCSLKEVANTIAIPKKEIEVVYNGCDFNSNSNKSLVNIKEEMGISKSDKVIIFVGSIERDKGVFELLDAFSKLRQKYPELHLILIGSGPEYNTLKNNRFSNRIHFVGTQLHYKVFQWLKAADLFVLPTYYEGLPNAVLEAMACGVPVIASKVGGIPEIIEDGKNGILVSARDVKSLMEAIEYLLLNEDISRSIGLKGRETINQKFSWERNADDMIHIYKETISRVS